MELQSSRLFIALGLVTALSLSAAVLFEQILFVGLPFALMLVYMTTMDIRATFLLLLAAIPISTEFTFPNGFGTDLPDEPLMIGLMVVTLVYIAQKPTRLTPQILLHPLSIFVWLTVLSIAVSMIYAEHFGIALKYLLAKLWYVITFLILTPLLLRSERDWNKMFWWIFIPFVLATTKVVLHHATMGFGFKEINAAVLPFFRNHVNYAAILALFLPFAWFQWRSTKRFSWTWWFLLGGMMILFFGMATSYTRAAYLALFMAIAAAYAVRLRLMKLAIGGSLVGITLILMYFAQGNRFMDYAPSIHTVAHEGFGDIVSATSKLEDISTMERYYRWIAGFKMIARRPWTGYGPSGFYSNYREHTLGIFSTYVSDNPEQSTVHNYYLMVFVEQGVFGFLLFLILTFATLLVGERIYHQTTNLSRKRLIMAAICSTVIIDAFLLINDMVETDKVGTFYYINIAMLIVADLRNKEEKQAA